MLPAGTFAGKIVLVGRALQASPEPQRSAPDVFHTPFLLSSASATPGVELHATIVSNLLSDRFVAEPSPAARLALLLVLALVASLALLKLRPLTSLAATLVLAILFLTTASLLFSSRNLWLPIFSGTLLLSLVYVGHLVVGMITELRINALIKDTFGKYMDPRIVTSLLEQPEFIHSGGERRVMTVFFCDMEKFSLLSETMTPPGLVNFVNQYLTLLSEPVRQYKGIIDKYIGDAIMAFWGPPFSAENEHAKLACFAALDQFSKLEEFRRMLPDLMGLRKGLPEVNIRVGIATGDVVVGNIGSNVFKNYTVMGDTVNIAARLESANKQYGTRLLISEHTKALAVDAIETREIDAIQVMGKSESVRVFELLARKGALKPAVAALRDHFEQGLTAYRKQNWEQAEFHFRTCLEINPADTPSELFLTRLQYWRENPPPKDWDGVWALTEK
jgi:adenylate cyclase